MDRKNWKYAIPPDALKVKKIEKKIMSFSYLITILDETSKNLKMFLESQKSKACKIKIKKILECFFSIC